MKRIVIAVLTVALVLGAVFAYRAKMEKKIDRLEDLIVQLQESEQDERQRRLAQTLAQCWEDDASGFFAWYPHEDVSQVQEQIYLLRFAVKRGDRDAFLDAAFKALLYLEDVRDGERIRIGNVF